MELTIISPEKKQVYSIAWIEVETSKGSFVIQHGHAPIILILSPHKPIRFRLKNGKLESLNPRQGIIEVGRDASTIIMNKE
jgi:F0F1-type ATP synthase epsilon subunit